VHLHLQQAQESNTVASVSQLQGGVGRQNSTSWVCCTSGAPPPAANTMYNRLRHNCAGAQA
jgi:hypothetical protein